MKKIQKLWLGLFLIMFIMPEVLWSPVGNGIYELYLSHFGNTHPFKNNFLQNSDNINILSTVLFIQFLGLFAGLVYLLVLQKLIQHKAVLWLAIIFLTIAAIVTFFVFGISVSMRSIGF